MNKKDKLLHDLASFIKEELCEDNEEQWFCDKFNITKGDYKKWLE